MTGWRLGWAMGPKELMRHICKRFISSVRAYVAPTAQFAGIEAIRTGEETTSSACASVNAPLPARRGVHCAFHEPVL